MRDAFGLAQVDLPSETGAGIAAHIAGEGPAHWRSALAIVVHVLFGDVRVVQDHLLQEPAGRGIVFKRQDLGPDDAFEAVEHDAGPQARRGDPTHLDRSRRLTAS